MNYYLLSDQWISRFTSPFRTFCGDLSNNLRSKFSCKDSPEISNGTDVNEWHPKFPKQLSEILYIESKSGISDGMG